MRPFAHPRTEDLSLPALLAALGDPVRLAIVGALARRGELSCTAAVAPLALPKSTMSHHFRVLREAGVVRARPVGREALHALRTEDLEARFPGLLAAVLAGTPQAAHLASPPPAGMVPGQRGEDREWRASGGTASKSSPTSPARRPR